MQDPLIGTNVASRYEILATIGVGGWSTVYEARDNVLHRAVAIKVLHAHLALDEHKIQRFKREAQTASLLAHPCVAAVFDYGTPDAGRPYIVMELVQGQSLAHFIKQGNKLSCDDGIRIFSQVCDGLNAAHKLGLVHRDLKPGNVMLTESGPAKVLDFGIAKWTLQQAEDLTRTDELVGTPSYMSPEQCLGLAEIDGRADIYALGTVMYEASTGVKAFPGDKVLECLARQIKLMPPRLKSVCPSVDAPLFYESAIFKALEKNPSDRFQTMNEMKTALLHGTESNGFLRKLQQHLTLYRVNNKRAAIGLLIAAGLLLGSILANKLFFNVENRSIQFPQKSVGTIFLLFRNSEGLASRSQKYAPAQNEVLVPKDSLVRLTDVPNNAISLEFLTALKPNDIQDLDLSDLPLTDDNLNKINQLKDLQALRVDGTDISDEGFRQLDLPKLGGLDLSNTKVTDKGLSFITSLLTKVDYLSLRKTAVTNAGLKGLRNLNRLRTIILSHTKIDDEGLIQIEQLRRLGTLDLAGDNITDKGAVVLGNMHSLKNLDLQETKVTDASVDVLSKMSNLQSLNISHTEISEAGFNRIVIALRNSKVTYTP